MEVTVKLSMQTILTNLVENTIKEWQLRLPDKKLEDYENWRVDIVNKIDYLLQKQGIDLSELIVETVDKPNEVIGKKEE